MTVSFSYTVSKRELLIFFYRHRLRLLLAFWVPLTLCFVVSFFPTPLYKASSVLIVRLGSEYVYQPEVGTPQNGPTAVIPFNQEQIFKAEVAILSSADLHAQVISAIGIKKLFPRSKDLPEAVECFDKRLNIVLEKESSVIDVSFEHADRSVAVQALDTLLKLYFDKRKQLYHEPRAKLAEAELQTRHERALVAEQAVEEYKRAHKIYSLGDQRAQLLEQRNDAQKQAANIVSPALERKIAAYTRELDRLDVEEREFGALQREAQIAEDAYSLYSRKLDEAKAHEDLQQERSDSVRVIQPPTTPSEPRKLQPVIMLVGILVSLISALLMAAYTEFSSTGFIAPEQIERHLNLPVLAVIPLRR